LTKYLDVESIEVTAGWVIWRLVEVKETAEVLSGVLMVVGRKPVQVSVTVVSKPRLIAA